MQDLDSFPWPPRVAVIGLGYVGLPLAVALARHMPVTGFDISRPRIAELKAGRDRTGEVAPMSWRPARSPAATIPTAWPATTSTSSPCRRR
jgi:glycine/D-amino acid oxidase-like deaminating enzyme